MRWLYPKPSAKTKALAEKYKNVLDIDIESEIKRGYVSSGEGRSFEDEWGVTWKRSAFYFEMVKHPLEDKSFEEIKKYKFPDPSDKERVKGLKGELAA